MRPLELRLRNFRSYFGEDSVFDFRERTLVGVVGPIGSGKSSLLDAIAFALYGRTPTVAASTKALIHQRADGATVSLRFQVEGNVWEVTRALRRKGQSVHGLHRLAGDSDDAEKLETIVLEGEVNEKVVELLGLEFDGFSRSVMLAQGRFAEFLRSRPAERDKVLKGVFGHDRIDAMRVAAKDRAATAQTKVETISVRLEAADSLAKRIEASQQALQDLDNQLELLRKAEAKFADHRERTEATERVIAHAETRLEELASLSGRIPPAPVVADVVKIAESAAATRARLGEALEDALQQLSDSDEALAALEPAELRGRIDEAGRFEATLQQLNAQIESTSLQRKSAEARRSELQERLETAQSQREAALESSRVAQEALAAATTARDAAAAALHDAQHADMAATLRSDVSEGDACPVCEQVIATMPKSAQPASAAAESALADCEKSVVAATAETQRVGAVVAKAGESVAALEAETKAAVAEDKDAASRLGKLEDQVKTAAVELKKLVGESSAAELRQTLESKEAAAAEARKKADLARSEHDESIRSSQAADKELGALRISVAEMAAKLAVEVAELDEPAQVGTAVAELRAALATETETLTTAKSAAQKERAEVAAADRELRRELEIDGEFATHLAEVTASVDLRRQQIEADQAELKASDDLRQQRTQAEHQLSIYQAIAADLTDSKFVRYLLDEEKRDLANLGSDHFERLSSGRYRFSTDGEFRVVDLTSADAVRKADSLSGGETFLASLALALALAEMVSRTGGRLDAFFLDEGFGSLDPEHLDLAMEGIEQLAAGSADRLVLVVSHVSDMRHRLEDLIELDRNPVTGDTVVVHG